MLAVVIQYERTVWRVTIDVIHSRYPSSEKGSGRLNFTPVSRSQFIAIIDSDDGIRDVGLTAGIVFVIGQNRIVLKGAVGITISFSEIA